MRNVVVCMAKDEDHYIDEWIDYHLKLGFSDVFVYQHEWRYSGPFASDRRVHLLECSGKPHIRFQGSVYDGFLRDAGKGLFGDIDFAAFFDVDEFMCLKPGLTLDGFLSRFSGVSGVALNWKFFGDSGLNGLPEDGDYSVVKRFTRCSSRLHNQVKTIVNVRVAGPARFSGPHALKASLTEDCVLSATGDRFVHGWKNRDEKDPPAWLNHYFCKTREEFETIKRPRGRLSREIGDPEHIRPSSAFDEHNYNHVCDTTARDFYLKACALQSGGEGEDGGQA